jgi:hypothetical protein
MLREVEDSVRLKGKVCWKNMPFVTPVYCHTSERSHISVKS